MKQVVQNFQIDIVSVEEVSIPSGIPLNYTAFTAVGAIAMQGVRIADVRLGEKVVVIGLGLVGLLTVEILKSGGCSVYGVDINPQRVAWGEENDICTAGIRATENIFDRILEFTCGYGVGAVINTAAGYI